MVEVEVPGEKPLGLLSGSSVSPGHLQSDKAAPKESQLQPLDVLGKADVFSKAPLKCPECGSSELRKSGKAQRADGSRVQRYRCLDCNLRFRGDSAERLMQAYSRNTLFKQLDAIEGTRQVCAILQETKNLDPTAIENRPAAGVTLPSSDAKSELLAFTWKMQKEGYAYETVRMNTSALRALLTRGANFADSESIKEVLAKESTWSPCRRRNIINAYTLYLKFHGQKWEKPRCIVTKKIPFIPTEQEIDDLIAGTPQMISAFLQILKETAMRAGEAKRLLWTDVDLERRVIILNDPEKGSLPRIFNNLTSKLLGILNSLPRSSEHVFGERSLNSFKAVYQRSRNKIAFKLANPRLKQVHFHTLRHWKATMECHYTKDILHVKEFLGHREINNTLIYISLDKALFQNLPNDDFTIRVVHNAEEAAELGKLGFEPFDVVDNVRLYRKRK